MSLSVTIPLHAHAERFGPTLAKYANGNIGRFTFFDGAVGGEIEANDDDRKILVRWLGDLPKPSRITLNQIASTAEGLTANEDKPSFRADVRKGRIDLTLTLALHVPDNKSTLAYMLASIISAGLSQNVRKCPHCDEWFFAVPKSGPIQTYCSPRHQNAARQKRYRESKGKS